MEISRLIALIAIVFTLTVISTNSKSIKNKNQEESLLKTIRKLAKEAGHKNPRRIGIDLNNETCYTKPCLESAIGLLEAINLDADPCDPEGFGEFACHRRIHREPESKYQSEFGNKSLVTWLMAVKNERFTREILESKIGAKGDTMALRNAKICYDSCLNLRKLKVLGTKALWEVSKRFGGWPALTQSEPVGFQWEKLAAFNAKFKTKTLLFDVTPVYTENGIELTLDKGLIATNGFDVIDDRQKMKTLLEKIRLHWDEFETGLDLPESFETAIEFTMRARKTLVSYLSFFDIRIPTRMTISELTKLTHHKINWLEFFQTVYEATNIDIDEESIVHVNSKYVQTLTKLWHTPGMWESSILQSEFFSIWEVKTSLNDFVNAFTTLEGELLALACTHFVKGYFGAALSKEFLRRHPFPPEVKDDVHGMMDNILQGVKKYVKNSKLFFSDSKKKLTHKFEAVNSFLGYPPWLDNHEQFSYYYAKMDRLSTRDEDYLKNSMQVEAWKEGVDRMGLVPEIDNLHYWPLNKFIVDVGGASYLALSNAMIIPAPTSAPPLYQLGAPGYVNYGGLGFILAHELGHGMDPTGIFFDRHGNYKPKGLISTASNEKYQEWIEGVKRDYAGSTIHYHGPTNNETMKTNLPAHKTIKDDVADLIGLQVAYNAYKVHLKGVKTDLKLPGLEDVPNEQLFYVTYANMWCEEISQNAAENLWASVHSPGYNRATIPLKRSKQFLKTFGCPANDNPFDI